MLLSTNAVCERFEGRVVILNAENGKVFELNPTATSIWDHLQADSELAIKHLIALGYSKQNAISVVEEFIQELAQAGLVQA